MDACVQEAEQFIGPVDPAPGVIYAEAVSTGANVGSRQSMPYFTAAPPLARAQTGPLIANPTAPPQLNVKTPEIYPTAPQLNSMA